MSKAIYILNEFERRSNFNNEGDIENFSEWLEDVFKECVYSSDEDLCNNRIIHTMDDSSRIIEDLSTGDFYADEGDLDA